MIINSSKIVIKISIIFVFFTLLIGCNTQTERNHNGFVALYGENKHFKILIEYNIDGKVFVDKDTPNEGYIEKNVYITPKKNTQMKELSLSYYQPDIFANNVNSYGIGDIHWSDYYRVDVRATNGGNWVLNAQRYEGINLSDKGAIEFYIWGATLSEEHNNRGAVEKQLREIIQVEELNVNIEVEDIDGSKLVDTIELRYFPSSTN